MLNPTVKSTFAPRAETPILRDTRRHRHKLSAIAAIVVSPKRRECNLLFQLLPTDENFTSDRIVDFVRRIVSRNARGRTHIVWDRAGIHRGSSMRRYLGRCRRVTCHHFPPYAPELNPVELVWSHTKWHDLANCVPDDIDELRYHAERSLNMAARRRPMLAACIKHCVGSSNLGLK